VFPLKILVELLLFVVLLENFASLLLDACDDTVQFCNLTGLIPLLRKIADVVVHC
jgi:hypothetical protein